LYQEVGVPKYWMIRILDKTVFVYVLQDGVLIGQQTWAEYSKINVRYFHN
jgi:Uma2 family endonuclease